MASPLTKKILILDFDGVITELNLPQDLAKATFPGILGRILSKCLGLVEDKLRSTLIKPLRMFVEFRSALRVLPCSDVEPFLKVADYPIYLASMQTGIVLDYFLRKHGLKKYFKEVISSDRFRTKEAQIRYIINLEGKARYLLVDDSEWNVSHLASLGIKTFLLKRQQKQTLFDVYFN